MVDNCFDKNRIRHVVKGIVIDAMKARSVDFYSLDPIVQTTLLVEALQVGVQQSLDQLMLIKHRYNSRMLIPAFSR